MIKPKFTIRTMMIATLLVGISLPTAIAYYDDVVAYFNPPPEPSIEEKLTSYIDKLHPLIGVNVEVSEMDQLDEPR